jgi:hypothetical protein
MKADLPILSRLFGNVIDFNALKPSKVDSPILLTLSGIIISSDAL